MYGARKATLAGAGGPIEFPQDVHRADQPVLMHGVQLDPPAVAKGYGADQGDVMEVHYIKSPLVQNLFEPRRFQAWMARLLGYQGREYPSLAPQTVHNYVRVIGVVLCGLSRPWTQRTIRILAVDHFYVMTSPGQLV